MTGVNCMTDMKSIKNQTKNLKNRLTDLINGGDTIDLSSIIKEIQRVRKSGQKPEQTIGDKDLFAYECELCLQKIKEGELTQCPFCGRWVCRKDCFSKEEGACVSCASVIRLKRESINNIKELVRSIDGKHEEKDEGGEGEHV
jgi:hypothetical protein